MAQNSKIEWTTSTWNPITGCSKVSAGCEHCYAETMARRLHAMGNPRYADGFEVRLHSDLLDLPLRWRQPRLVFVNSMSDLFHEHVPLWFVEHVFETIRKAHWHTFQILTKRSQRLRELAPDLPWPENLWMGVTVENEACADRVADLCATPAVIKFISAEPLIAPLNVEFRGIDWVIVGGESGPRARPIRPEWVCAIRDRCLSEGVPFFFKQWGGANKKRAGRSLDGRTWDEFPRPKADASLIAAA